MNSTVTKFDIEDIFQKDQLNQEALNELKSPLEIEQKSNREDFL